MLFLAYTGIELDVPVAGLALELAVTVLVPTVVGVAIRTAVPRRVEPIEPVLSAGASLAYLALLLAVVGPNAVAMRAAPGTVAVVAGLALALNVTGYVIAMAARRLTPDPADHTALLCKRAEELHMTTQQTHPSETTRTGGSVQSSSATTVRWSSGTNIAAGACLLIAPFALGYGAVGAAVGNAITVGLLVLALAWYRTAKPAKGIGASWTNAALGGLGAVSAVAGKRLSASR